MNDLDRIPATMPLDSIPYVYKKCKVERVYDGDTITVTINHGFNLKAEGIELRLFGMNAPEVRGESKPDGVISREWLRKTIAPNATKFSRWGWIEGGETDYIDVQTVKVGSKTQAKGKYGRYLAVLWDGEGKNINRIMVDSGLAVIANY